MRSGSVSRLWNLDLEGYEQLPGLFAPATNRPHEDDMRKKIPPEILEGIEAHLGWVTLLLMPSGWTPPTGEVMRRRPFAHPQRKSTVQGHCLRPTIERMEPRRTPSTFTVTNNADGGPGSLRQAIIDANTTAGADEIRFNIAVDAIGETAVPTPGSASLDHGRPGPGPQSLVHRKGWQQDRADHSLRDAQTI